MSFLNPTMEDDYRIERMAALNPTTELLPGQWTGIATAIPKGVASGAEKLQNLSEAIGRNIDTAADSYLPSWLASYVHYAPFNPGAVQNLIPDDIRKQNEATREVVSQWAATGTDPRQTGYLGRELSGAADNLTVGLVGSTIGGPIGAGVLSGATYGHADYVQAKKDGLDDTTALAHSILTGGSATLGAFLPTKFGNSFTLSTVGGAATNVALGMAQRGATSSLLENNGYKDMADQYRLRDHEGMVADAIFGSVFGGIGHIAESRRATPDQVDVAAAMASGEHYARSAPGVPTSPAVANTHGDAMREALDALAEGREPNTPADIATRIADGVVPDPQHDSAPAAHEAALDSLAGYDEAVRTVERVPEPESANEATTEPVAPSAFSQEFPLFDTFTAHRMESVLEKLGDQVFEGTPERGTTYREAITKMHAELAEADTFAKAHEAAAACFVTTGAAA